jgi:hypothetical protein
MKNLLCLLLLLPFVRAKASDGFDNNFIGSNAHEMLVDVFSSGNEKDVLFGPSTMSSGSYFIQVPNGIAYYNLGVANYFKVKQVKTHPRSAYFDRVNDAIFYYRIYNINDGSPPGFTAVSLTAQNSLDPNTCYTLSQQQDWLYTFSPQLDVTSGLGVGTYYMEFYLESNLYDVGDESDPCNINALQQCNNGIQHTGRMLTSQFPNGAVDPNICPGSQYYYYNLALANPTKIRFQITTPAPLTWAYIQLRRFSEGFDLDWGTEQEKNVDHFDVQRSVDGLDWHSLTLQHATGTSSRLTAYEFRDDHPLSGLNYYRIVENDFDGSSDVSRVVAARFGDPDLTVFPNPALDFISFSMDPAIRKQTSRVLFYDLTGRICDVQPWSDQSISVGNLVQGLYFIEFRGQEDQRIAFVKFYKG